METVWTMSDKISLDNLTKKLFDGDPYKVFTQEEMQTDDYKAYESLLTKRQIHMLNVHKQEYHS